MKKGGACCLVQGLLIVIFVSLMFRTQRQLINPFRYRLISHLHDGVFYYYDHNPLVFFLHI